MPHATSARSEGLNMQPQRPASTSIARSSRTADQGGLPVRLSPYAILRPYVWLMPLTYPFALAAIAPLPLVYLVAVVTMVRWVWRSPLHLRVSDILLIVFFLLGLVPVLITPTRLAFTHASAWAATLFFYFIVPRILLGRMPRERQLSRLIASVLFIVSCFVIVQYAIQNAFGFDILRLVPHPDINSNSTWTVFQGAIYRARGLSEEPGHSSLFFELGLPFAALAWRAKPFRRGLSFLVCLVAYLMLFSSASIVSMIIAIGIAHLWYTHRSYRNLVIGIAIPIALILAAGITPPLRNYLQNTVILKTTDLLDSRGSIPSSQDRRQRFADLVLLLRRAPQGVGFGTISASNASGEPVAGIHPPSSFISLYGDVAAAAGLVGLACLGLFLLDRIRRLMGSRSPFAHATFVALVALCIHYIFVGNFWYPFLWFAVALADHVRRFSDRSEPSVGPRLA